LRKVELFGEAVDLSRVDESAEDELPNAVLQLKEER